MPDYSYVDQPGLLQYLFYPRADATENPDGSYDYFVTVEDGTRLACRFYEADPTWPWMLYFHGNGEVASDYDDIAPFYQLSRINLVVVDYRGYGLSEGRPSVSNLLTDARQVLQAVKGEAGKRDADPKLWVMGRSMGSIAALSLAHHDHQELQGLIIESGFASVTRLITHLGLMAPNLELKAIEEACLKMIKDIYLPALILHGDRDTLVPWAEGKLIYDTLGSSAKQMVTITGASHNDIIFRDLPRYFGAIHRFLNG
ncbi:MAG: alpha/beta hydrolase [Syntrophomonadaceae bacterium]